MSRQRGQRPRWPLMTALLTLFAAAALGQDQTQQTSTSSTVASSDEFSSQKQAILSAVQTLKAAGLDGYKTWAQSLGRIFKDDKDVLTRFTLFNATLDVILSVNTQNLGWFANVNKFADWTPQEKADLAGALLPTATRRKSRRLLNEATFAGRRLTQSLPASFDWRASNKVTPVKDQGYCGNCWAFAAAAVVESLNLVTSNSTQDLSEQEMTSCAIVNGCTKAPVTTGLDYTRTNGVTTEAIYPFTQTSNNCNTSLLAGITANQKTWIAYYDVYQNESFLQSATFATPVAVYWRIASDFYAYAGGVYSSSLCFNGSGHAMAVVGWDTDATTGTPYWIVKNSWGTGWGESGYIRVVRNQNMCDIGTYIMRPYFAPPPPAPPPPSPPAPPPSPAPPPFPPPPKSKGR